MAKNKLADLSTEFAIEILKLTENIKLYITIFLINHYKSKELYLCQFSLSMPVCAKIQGLS